MTSITLANKPAATLDTTPDAAPAPLGQAKAGSFTQSTLSSMNTEGGSSKAGSKPAPTTEYDFLYDIDPTEVDSSLDSKEKEIQTLGEICDLDGSDKDKSARKKAAMEAFLKKVEESNGDKYRELVEAVKKDLQENGGQYQFDTSPAQWRLMWIARQAIESTPKPDGFSRYSEERQKKYRDSCVRYLTPFDIVNPTSDKVKNILLEIIQGKRV